MSVSNGRGWRLIDGGTSAVGGILPVNPSGGLLGANPIGAAGLVRFAEAAMQVGGGRVAPDSTAPAWLSATPPGGAPTVLPCGWSAATVPVRKRPLTCSRELAARIQS